jgi:hypothetical protein
MTSFVLPAFVIVSASVPPLVLPVLPMQLIFDGVSSLPSVLDYPPLVMSVPCATLHHDPFSTLSSSYTKNKSCCQFSYQTLRPALGSIVRTKSLFVSASQELPGYGSQKLKQTTNFWGGFLAAEKLQNPV